MIYLLTVPKLGERRLSESECKALNETNNEFLLISADPDSLKAVIEDSLGAVLAEKISADTWAVSGFDQIAFDTLNLFFNDRDVVHIKAEEMDYAALEKFFKCLSIVDRIPAYCF